MSAGVGVAVVIAGAAVAVTSLQPAPRVEIQPAAPGSAGSEATSSTPATPGAGGDGEVLQRPAAGALAPGTGAQEPSTCATDALPDGAATVVIGLDVARPPCLQVLPGQTLRVVDGRTSTENTGATVTASLGGYRFRLDPGEQVTLDLPVSSYLEAGVHVIDGEDGSAPASIWVLQAPAVSAGQQAPLDALLAFARAPSDATFAELPLAARVSLGRDDQIITEVAADELRAPGGWSPGDVAASTLDLLAAADPEQLVFLAGQRPACTGVVPPAPAGTDELTRLSVQTVPSADCSGWFAVDLYVDEAGTGRIHAVLVQTAVTQPD